MSAQHASDELDPKRILDLIRPAWMLAESYHDSLAWFRVFSQPRGDWEHGDELWYGPAEFVGDLPVPPPMQLVWEPMVSWAAGFLAKKPTPSELQPGWETNLRMARLMLGEDREPTTPESLAMTHPLACLFGALAETFLPLEVALRKWADWRMGVPFRRFEDTRGWFPGCVCIDGKGRIVPDQPAPFSADDIHIAEREKYAFENALEIVKREADRRLETEAENVVAPKPRAKPEEMNLRARAALKDRPPRGKKRWSERTLAKAIGCSAPRVHELPAWQAYSEEHGLKRRKEEGTPKVVSFTDSVQATEGRADEELEKLIAEHKADFEPSPLVPGPRKLRPIRRKL